ncbi:4-amino-4-deoxy-L-arabinose-phosphoundecaprenol flippase subunit ArnF [Pseudomonas sp. 14P_8.1_Bac3]|uniref:4-amino-4-deoxy-L-arabinose-phosphoundecaprenol flippase subunit ArnF n=1 Tax=Pseudomonas sp. 14P_8.1_Bac3 TaxID=2971621 RepID=UPI0021C576A9|nr:4-amino-4-deoxy-L-arabinose-phosphoundecaprenol flippase subunit ArnF [Pseudomonas sp. 14P_8.1_Bac3]MCU1760855.1 4-amino-4-deoxy-L-arabinose-phosphoundecaprenol flippase subunit ArnF [Pseudomonas sp. 14P_8.1_Bac3]
MSLRRGLAFALGSVLLGSAAQLGMRWSMTRLPPPEQMLDAPIDPSAVVVVLLAILAYALSMLSWLAALRDVPLGRAYSLLSISYALVYLLAAALPAFNEDFSLFKSLGVALVILGVVTINSRPAASNLRSDL